MKPMHDRPQRVIDLWKGATRLLDQLEPRLDTRDVHGLDFPFSGLLDAMDAVLGDGDASNRLHEDLKGLRAELVGLQRDMPHRGDGILSGGASAVGADLGAREETFFALAQLLEKVAEATAPKAEAAQAAARLEGPGHRAPLALEVRENSLLVNGASILSAGRATTQLAVVEALAREWIGHMHTGGVPSGLPFRRVQQLRPALKRTRLGEKVDEINDDQLSKSLRRAGINIADAYNRVTGERIKWVQVVESANRGYRFAPGFVIVTWLPPND